jgi:hypothetical protein
MLVGLLRLELSLAPRSTRHTATHRLPVEEVLPDRLRAPAYANSAGYTQTASIVLSANAIVSCLGSLLLRKSKISRKPRFKPWKSR